MRRNAFKNLEEVYQKVRNNSPQMREARLLLEISDWYTRICDFDPKTGKALPQSLSTLLRNIQKFPLKHQNGHPKDRLSRIVDHAGESLRAIIRKPRGRILREHAIMPIYAACEVDSVSVHWLSRRPGRNLREKLANKPYIKAVNRRMCLDTAENRLVKAFVGKLELLLLARNDTFADHSEEAISDLRQLIQRWFQEDGAREISPWSNLPPNNTLLQDKNYRKIWDVWLWLQAMDANIRADHERLDRDWQTLLFWTIVAKLNALEQIRFIEQPIYFDYENFSIRPDLKDLQGIFFSNNASYPQPILIGIANATNLYWECEKQKVSLDTSKIPLSKRNVPTASHYAEFVVGKLLNNDYSKLQKRTVAVFDKNPKCNNITVDIYGNRPKFMTGSGTEHITPFRFVKQYWNSDKFGRVPIDCDVSNAVTLRPEVTTITMLGLFSDNGDYPTALLSDAAMAFTSKLLNVFEDSQEITYLIPDSINEFSLENIRRSMNFFFPKSMPLPRSIAAVFFWQASKNFTKFNFKHGDIVLAIENGPEGISLTPLVGLISNELSKTIPESKGVYWERHPSIFVEGVSTKDIVKSALKNDDCTISNEMANLFGLEGLVNEVDSLSWIGPDQQWYNLPSALGELLWQKTSNNNIRLDDIHKTLKNIPGRCKDSTAFLLPIGNSFRAPTEEHSFHWLDSVPSPVKGGQILSQWQFQAGDFQLWHDHLPELLFKDIVYSKNDRGYWGYFELVKETKINPKKGKKIQIPVKESFTLPAGKTHYQFPLVQGAAGHELHYMAHLKSRAFPLSQDTVCSLIMTYTYGADDPYELKFIPNNHDDVGFKSVRVEWRELKHSETAKDIFPGFPARYKWRDFDFFPRNDGGTSNLFDWINKNNTFIKETKNFFIDGRKKSYRHVGEIQKWGLLDKNGNTYGFINFRGQDVFCHGHSFVNARDTEEIGIGTKVSFEILSTEKGNSAYRVALGKILPVNDDYMKHLRSKLRFPMLTIWNQAHSLSEVEVADWFRQSMQEGIEDALYLIRQNYIAQKLKDELLFYLCCLQKDAPQKISSKLMQILKNSENNIRQLEPYWRHIANAIGDCELEWQSSLIKKILVFTKSEDSYKSALGFQILSIAFWRAEQLVFRFSQTEIRHLVKSLFTSIENGINNVIRVSRRDNSIYVNQYEIFKMELLLALLRTRKSKDENIKNILSPEKEITKKFVAIIDNLTQQICDNDLDVWSRVSLKIDKPDAFQNTPNLLYALRMYLTGDSGANTIQVTGVNDEDKWIQGE